MKKTGILFLGKDTRIPISKRNMLIVLIIIQAFICFFCFSQYKEEHTVFDLEADTFESQGVFIENFLDSQENGYYIDNTHEGMNNFASTPKINLKRGSYKITIHYQTNHYANAYNIMADNADFREKLGNFHKSLPQERNIYTTELRVSRELKNFNLGFDFDDGYFFVSRVEIRENRNWIIGVGILFCILFLCLDILYWSYEKWKHKLSDKKWKNWLFSLILIIFLASLPLCNPYLFNGTDIMFHLLRIDGIREGLQSGHFPVRMQPNWLNGYGYGVSIFYGDVLLYFPAILRIFGCGVQSAFKWFVLFMNIITAGISYYCFKRIFHSTKLGLLGCLLHTVSIYRLFNVYVRASIGEFCALTFLPLIFISVYEILWTQKDEKIPKDSWIYGVIGFWGLITCHIITTELTAAFVLIICLIYFKRTFRKGALFEFIKMGIGILICSLWFILPFIDMWINGNYRVQSAASGFEVQTQGGFFSQLFNIFPYVEGDPYSYSVIEGIGRTDELSITVGGGLLAGALLFIAYWINYGEKKEEKLRLGIRLLVISIILSIMTTMVFPWHDLQELSSVLDLMIKNMQFPWRLYGLLTLTLTVLSCLTVRLFEQTDRAKEEKAGGIILIFTLLSISYMFSSILHNNHTIYIHNTDDLDTYKIVGGEYVPANTDVSSLIMLDTSVKASEHVNLESVDRKYLNFHIVCNSLGEGGYIDLPLLYYRGYRLSTAPDASEMTIVDNGHGLLRIMLTENFAGTIEIDYYGALSWKIAEIVSLAGIIILLVLLIQSQVYMKSRRETRTFVQ